MSEWERLGISYSPDFEVKTCALKNAILGVRGNKSKRSILNVK